MSEQFVHCRDRNVADETRLIALHYLPPGASGFEETLAATLADAWPPLRALALEKVEQVHATNLIAQVEELTHDPAVFVGFEEDVLIAKVAERVLATLRADPDGKDGSV